MIAETDVIRMCLKRAPRGLLVSVKTHPEIENFMEGLGSGLDILDVGEYGRLWSPTEDGNELKVYGLPVGNGLIGWIRNGGGPSYRLDRVGAPLFEGGDEGGNPMGGNPMGVNLSFLRILGTSSVDGASFIVSGVYSLEVLKEFKKIFADAAEGFYKNFLKSVNIQVIISTVGP